MASKDMDRSSVISTLSTRQRRMTEKGLLYTKEQKEKLLSISFRQLRAKQDAILSLLEETTNIKRVTNEHSQFLTLLEKHYALREQYVSLLDLEAKKQYEFKVDCEENPLIFSFKAKLEKWFSEHTVAPSDSISQKAGSQHSHSSQGSAISMARMKEDQKKAELQAKASALKEMEKLELDKLKLRIQEQELEIKTELAISEAKSKVIDNYEKSGSQLGIKKETENPEMQVQRNTEQNPQNLHTPPYTPNHDNIQRERPPPVDYGSVVRHLKKPSAELKTFSGDPMDYKRFMRQFNSMVVSNSDNVDEVVNYLDQYTSGEANKIVSGFSYLEGGRAYQAILHEFEGRYGDSDIIASAFVKRALEWPNIRIDNGKALDEYAIFLTECENAVQTIDAMRILEYPDNMKRMIMKMPYQYHDQWRSIVDSKRFQGIGIYFHDIVDFVRKEARKANDPIYGKRALTEPKPNRTKTRSFATNLNQYRRYETDHNKTVEPDNRKVKSLQKPCIYCKGDNHGLEDCYKWIKLSHENQLTFLRSKGLCFRCLHQGHISKECEKKVSVCTKCGLGHQTVLHIVKPMVQTEQTRFDQKERRGDSQKTVSCMGAGQGECTMAIVPVQIRMKNSSKTVHTYAFMDPGSSVSFMSQDLKDELGSKGKKMKMTLQTMGKPHTMYTYSVDNLEVSDLDGHNSVSLPKVYTKDRMPVSHHHIPQKSDISHWEHLNQIELPQINANIGLLIGNNVPDAYTPFHVKTGPQGSPHATFTRLGWIVWNVVRENTPHGKKDVLVNRVEVSAIEEIEELKKLDRLVRSAIDQDFPERAINDKKEESCEDKKFMNIVNNKIKLVDGHYVIPLPLKNEEIYLPDNHTQALQRLKSLKRKMEGNETFRRDYKKFMDTILDKGYAEQVPEHEVTRRDGRVWFIPHHGIYHPRKPDKIRVVFDCTAMYQGISLNHLLLQGPDLTNTLLGVLLRFRENPVAIMGDVESMFYQVQVPKEDRDMLRFYWWPDDNVQKSPHVYRMCVHLFGAVSSPTCSTLALQQTAEDNQDSFDQKTIETVKRSFYVDDLLKSENTDKEVLTLVENVSALCLKGGFKLTKWTSNSHEVMKSIAVADRAKSIRGLDLDSDLLPSERALGVFWKVEKDCFSFHIQFKPQLNTRRNILSVISSVFDPIGYAAPYVLIAKILQQDLCRRQLDWNQEITGNDLKIWQKWLDGLQYLESINLPRCYKPPDFGLITSCQIHMFSDASENGYGIVAYLRLTNDRGQICVSFILGKSRVSPLKKITIPRMELTAATIAVKICRLIKEELTFSVTETFYWTDSMSVLRYICNDSARYHTFVANRVNLIRDATSVDQWNYIESKSNPADASSRGMKIEKFLRADLWFRGPEFLQHDQSEWQRKQPDESLTLPSDDSEVKQVVSTAIATETADIIHKLICHYSDWIRLNGAVAYIRLFIKYLQTKTNLRKENSELKKPVTRNYDPKKEFQTELTMCEMKGAEKAIIRVVQRHHFADTIRTLRQKGTRNISSCIMPKLDTFLHEGLLRVGGRLERADMTFDMKHPVILPKCSHVSTLILRDIHRRVGHLGKNMMLSVLRQHFWMLGANSGIKRVISKCVLCKRYQAKVLEQKMADLPLDRLTPDEPPFSHTGIDFFGPFHVTRGRSSVKRYGVIFVCLASRAVHLELAHSLDTDSCINALRRFVARRGSVKSIRSDNGTNIVSCEKELRAEIEKWNNEKIRDEMMQKSIAWEFNPPTASHFGGIWERMIRTVRKILHSLMQQQVVRLDDEALHTLFCEVESILNNRPITDTPVDPNDLTVLTPNHLLQLQPGENMPPGIFNKGDAFIRRRWKQVQYLADQFWKRWKTEYITQLQERQKWCAAKDNIAVGDIVLMVENSPRNSWAMGKVIETVADKKRFVRTVKVKTASTELVRPISKLVLILSAGKCADNSKV